MSVPVYDQDRIVAVVGVGNKDQPYDSTDTRQLQLFMDSMWKIIKQRRNEEDLKDKIKELEKLNTLMIGRELRIRELKDEIRRLEKKKS